MKTTKLIYSTLIIVIFFAFSSNTLFAQVNEEKKVEEVETPTVEPNRVKSEPVPGAEVYIEQEGNKKNNKKAKEEKEKKEKKEGKKEEEAEIEN